METTKKIQSLVDQAECLYSFDEINSALDRMANEITQQLKDTNPVILCVLNGALVPMGHLLTRLHFPLQIDYLHATRYRGEVRGGDLHWLAEPRTNLKDRTILVVDDIMDGGLTLASIIDYCIQAGAKKVETAVMVSKNREREEGVNFEPNYIGVVTEDRFLFGFGLDYDGYLRNVPGIYAVNVTE